MALIIGLVLAIILFTYKTCDKQSRKTIREASERRAQEVKQAAKDFKEKYAVSYEELEAIEDKVSSRDEDAQNMCQRIKEEAQIADPSYYMISRGLLAQQGKISPKAAYSGFNCSLGNYYMHENHRKFMIWYDQELRNHGCEYELLFVPRDVDKSQAKPVTLDAPIVAGYYFWKPVEFFAGSVGEPVVVSKKKYSI